MARQENGRGPGGRRRTPETSAPRHPFRDSAIVCGVLAGLVVVIALATGGGLVRAVLVAAAFFVLATAWSWWRWRVRLEGSRRRP